ncbi:hypothetical protein L1987_70694 [Smallanthus sonchifolius]|uniref:Uncharacterized protein n=1 Tax=Smallanthus sonchifolius TaxID=185202 RepID=A0ACB9AQE2_9ASTR|nr:hypothetical protein L1987_70694 [Smallanthus sonchifolius]
MHEMMQSMMGQLTFLEEDKSSKRQTLETAEAGLVVAQQQMVTMGENVEVAVALATTCLMMFDVMVRKGVTARFPH